MRERSGMNRTVEDSVGGSITRQDLDLLYAAILRCDIGDPWDAESGCPRPMPESVDDAVATFDHWHADNIADVNAALDLCRALYAKCAPNAPAESRCQASPPADCSVSWVERAPEGEGYGPTVHLAWIGGVLIQKWASGFVGYDDIWVRVQRLQ